MYLKKDLIESDQFSITRKEQVYTAGGLVSTSIYAATIKILDTAFDIELIFAPMSDELPFQFLIGRNLLDALDAFFFGKKKIFWLKIAEE